MPKVSLNKHFPQADDWMWNYCQYLGSIRDKDGRPYDLGVWISTDKEQISFAIVDGPAGGDYHSGSIYYNDKIQPHIFKWLQSPELNIFKVTFKLAQEAGVFDNVLHKIDVDNIHWYKGDISAFLRTVKGDVECIAVYPTGEEVPVVCSRDMKSTFKSDVDVLHAETYEDINYVRLSYLICKS